MNYAEFQERVSRMTDEQQDRIRAKCQWEGVSWLGVAVDWPELFDIKGMPPATGLPRKEEHMMMQARRSNGHRVVIEFDGGGGAGAKLICPESGCVPAEFCGVCGSAYGDPEAEGCSDCRDDEAPTECWIKTWFDNVSADELLHGSIEVPIRAEWDGDHMVAHIEPETTK
jgi:hypothetical protein